MAHGSFCHLELKTTDIGKTRSFYETIFGWTFQIIPGFETYAMFQTPGGLGGGFDANPEGEKPSEVGPVLHIEVDDIDAAMNQCVKLPNACPRARTRLGKISLMNTQITAP